MRVVRAAQEEAGALELQLELVLAVDADVAAGRVVVVVVERPATPARASASGTVAAMRPPGRSTRTISAIARSSSQMCSSTSDTMTRSKRVVGERQVERVAVDDAGPLRRR